MLPNVFTNMINQSALHLLQIFVNVIYHYITVNNLHHGFL